MTRWSTKTGPCKMRRAMLNRGKTQSALGLRLRRGGILPGAASLLSGGHGFSITEILVVLSIFSIILAGIYSAYLDQLKSSTREYRYAESDMELGIARNIMERDIAMAGYGLADSYGTLVFAPRAARGDNSGGALENSPDTDPDILTVMGTALGTKSRAAQGWTYMTAVAGGVPTFATWGDPREDVRTDASAANNDDAVIIIEPSTRTLLAQGTSWLFRYNGNANLTTLPVKENSNQGTAYASPTIGTIVYGLQSANDSAPAQPYYAVRYYLDDGASNPSNCAPDTFRLLRAESTASATPTSNDPLLACVLDFQVAFGLDTNGDGVIDDWDNCGKAAASLSASDLRKNLKQVRAYILIQSGNREIGYTYPSATVRVGDASLGTGRDVILTAEQRNYRWRVMTLNVTPRNMR